jgi:hypothetical protein
VFRVPIENRADKAGPGSLGPGMYPFAYPPRRDAFKSKFLLTPLSPEVAAFEQQRHAGGRPRKFQPRPTFLSQSRAGADEVQWLPRPGNEHGRSPSVPRSCGRQDQGDSPYAVATSAKTPSPLPLSLVARRPVPQGGPALLADSQGAQASPQSEEICRARRAPGLAIAQVVEMACGLSRAPGCQSAPLGHVRRATDQPVTRPRVSSRGATPAQRMCCEASADSQQSRDDLTVPLRAPA